MFKDIIIELYLFIFKLVFNVFKLFPIKNKVTFVVSFGDNSLSVYETMKKQAPATKIVFLKDKTCKRALPADENVTVIPFETINIVAMVKSIYHLATSRYVLVDNYYGFLAATNFKEETEVIQLWHAAGAVKKFGLQDLTVAERTKLAKKRFNNVYQKFNKVVVGSEKMAKIFTEAFNIDQSVILRSGIPRTDIFYDENKQVAIRKQLYKENDALIGKKIILYAPTYREDELKDFSVKIDFEKMAENLSDDYVLLLKLHPAVKSTARKYEEQYNGFVFDYSTYVDVNELLLITDLLITDYSSVHFEYAILNKPIIFYAYDEQEYEKKRGIIGNYRQQLPGPLVKTSTELVECITNYKFDLREVESFANVWNKYSRGNSSLNLVNYMFASSADEKRDLVM